MSESNETTQSGASGAGTLTTVPLAAIRGNEYSPRLTFDGEAQEALERSIEAGGLVRPLHVRPVGADTYEVISGMRRLHALRRVRGRESPVSVEIHDVDAFEAERVALVENLAQGTLTTIEEAHAFARQLPVDHLGRQMTMDEYVEWVEQRPESVAIGKLCMPQRDDPAVREVAADIGVSGMTIEQRFSLLYLPAEVQAWVDNTEHLTVPYLTQRAARTIVQLIRGGKRGLPPDTSFADARDVMSAVAEQWILTDWSHPGGMSNADYERLRRHVTATAGAVASGERVPDRGIVADMPIMAGEAGMPEVTPSPSSWVRGLNALLYLQDGVTCPLCEAPAFEGLRWTCGDHEPLHVVDALEMTHSFLRQDIEYGDAPGDADARMAWFCEHREEELADIEDLLGPLTRPGEGERTRARGDADADADEDAPEGEGEGEGG